MATKKARQAPCVFVRAPLDVDLALKAKQLSVCLLSSLIYTGPVARQARMKG